MSVEQTPFRAIVWELCAKKLETVLREKIKADWFNNAQSWPLKEEEVTDRMRALMKEVTPVAMEEYFRRITLNAVSDLRNRM